MVDPDSQPDDLDGFVGETMPPKERRVERMRRGLSDESAHARKEFDKRLPVGARSQLKDLILKYAHKAAAADNLSTEEEAELLTELLGRAEARVLALARLDTAGLSALKDEFEIAVVNRFRDEVFGTERVTLNRFNKWLTRQHEAHLKGEVLDEKKVFIANAIQHFIREKAWALYAEHGQTGELVESTITTRINRGKRGYMLRMAGKPEEHVFASVVLPQMVAEKTN